MEIFAIALETSVLFLKHCNSSAIALIVVVGS